MSNKKKFSLFPAHFDKAIVISTLLLVVFGSFMVMSAEMGEQAGDVSIITKTAYRQGLFSLFGLVGMIIFSKIRVISFRKRFYWIVYIIILGFLLSTRFFGAVNGAYAWIRIGSFSLQPSEFAKVFIMVFGAKLISPNSKDKQKNFKTFLAAALIYVFIIVFYQKDFGSGFVLAAICFVIMLIPPYKEYNNYHLLMLSIIVFVLILGLIALSPIGTKIFEKLPNNYQFARFLASSNPFAYQYDSGYHVIMGLVSFATGGLFGLGYGNSIHKYMNFPNPSTDFILPVIVEEIGIFGFIFIIVFYLVIFIKLIRHSIKTKHTASKMILLGTFTYLAIHFVLNVGGVSGLIPLTGVPLLLISSGGSSLIASMCALGICESEIAYYQKEGED